MATYTKFYAFVEHLAEKVHNLGSDQIKIALHTSANQPSVSADAVLVDTVEIAYTNLSTRNVTTNSSSQTTGTYSLKLDDLILLASGGPVATFRYVSIYNDTPTSPADPLIAYADYGADVTINDTETFTIDFNAAGLFTLT